MHLVPMGGIMPVWESLPAGQPKEGGRHDRGTEGGSGPPGGRALLRAVCVAGRRRGGLRRGGPAGGDQRGSAPELEADQRDARPNEQGRHPSVGHVRVLLRLELSFRENPHGFLCGAALSLVEDVLLAGRILSMSEKTGLREDLRSEVEALVAS